MSIQETNSIFETVIRSCKTIPSNVCGDPVPELISYYDVSETSDLPSESTILAGDQKLGDIVNSFRWTPDSTNDNRFWLAVNKARSITFTHWIDSGDSNNGGPIGEGLFIELKGEVTVSEEVYQVYVSNWDSAFNRDIILT